MKRSVCAGCLAWLTIAALGCGGTPEIKPQTGDGTMTPEQKQKMEAEMKKSMERSYPGKAARPPGS